MLFVVGFCFGFVCFLSFGSPFLCCCFACVLLLFVVVLMIRFTENERSIFSSREAIHNRPIMILAVLQLRGNSALLCNGCFAKQNKKASV